MLTEQMLQTGVRGVPEERIEQYTVLLNEALSEFGIRTRQQVAMFLAQTGHESLSYRRPFETWTGSRTQLKYERDFNSGWTRDDKVNKKAFELGNSEPGDGYRFRGRGAIHLTGRYNYTEAGRDLGVDLVNNPDLAASPEYMFRIAGWFWRRHHINDAAVRGDVAGATKPINRGDALPQRRRRYEEALAAIPEEWTLNGEDVRRARLAYDKTNELVGPGGLVAIFGQQYKMLLAAHASGDERGRRLVLEDLHRTHAVLFTALRDPNSLFSSRMLLRLDKALRSVTDGALTLQLVSPVLRDALSGDWVHDSTAISDAARKAAWSREVRKQVEKQKPLTHLGYGLNELDRRLGAGETPDDAAYGPTLERVGQLRDLLRNDGSDLTAADRDWMNRALQSSSGLLITLDDVLPLTRPDDVRRLLTTTRSRRASASHTGPGMPKAASNSGPQAPSGVPAGTATVWRGPLSGPAGVANLGNRLAGAGLGGSAAAPSRSTTTAPATLPAAMSPLMATIDDRVYGIVYDALKEYDSGLWDAIRDAV